MSAAEKINPERMAELWREYPDELTALLELQAEKAAARAVQLAKDAKPEWVTKEEALELLECSYVTLNRYVNAGNIIKNSDAKSSRKWYNYQSIMDFKAGRI